MDTRLFYNFTLHSPLQTVELVPNGSRIPVTNDNKLSYLDSLARYRLVTCIKDEVDAFLKGLNDLIPDNLLCIFDENELEVSEGLYLAFLLSTPCDFFWDIIQISWFEKITLLQKVITPRLFG